MRALLSKQGGILTRFVIPGAAVAILVAVVMPSAAAVRMPKPLPVETVPTDDALMAVRFTLTIDGVEVASFPILGEITSAIRPPMPDDPQPGPTSTGLVVLRRPQGRSTELWAWHEAVIMGNMGARRNAEVVAYNGTGMPVARYRLENAWPAKIEIGALKASASEVIMESVTIVCDHIQRVNL